MRLRGETNIHICLCMFIKCCVVRACVFAYCAYLRMCVFAYVSVYSGVGLKSKFYGVDGNTHALMAKLASGRIKEDLGRMLKARKDLSRREVSWGVKVNNVLFLRFVVWLFVAGFDTEGYYLRFCMAEKSG